jgi:hypothetical protein
MDKIKRALKTKENLTMLEYLEMLQNPMLVNDLGMANELIQ